MAKYAVVTRERMTTEWDGSKRLSAKYLPSDVEAAIENGNVVKLEGLVAGEREIYKAVTPAVDTELKAIGLVTTPEVVADERKKNLEDFRNEAGEEITVDKLFSGDVFSITAEGFDGAPAVGAIVELKAGVKLNAVEELTSGSTQVGTIIDFVNNKYAVEVV